MAFDLLKNCRFHTVIVAVNVYFVSLLNCSYLSPYSKLNYTSNFGIKKIDFLRHQIRSVEITFWKVQVTFLFHFFFRYFNFFPSFRTDTLKNVFAFCNIQFPLKVTDHFRNRICKICGVIVKNRTWRRNFRQA